MVNTTKIAELPLKQQKLPTQTELPKAITKDFGSSRIVGHLSHS